MYAFCSNEEFSSYDMMTTDTNPATVGSREWWFSRSTDYPEHSLDSTLLEQPIFAPLCADTCRNHRGRTHARELLPASDGNGAPGPSTAVSTVDGNICARGRDTASTGDGLQSQAGDGDTRTRAMGLGQISAVVVLLNQNAKAGLQLAHTQNP